MRDVNAGVSFKKNRPVELKVIYAAVIFSFH